MKKKYLFVSIVALLLLFMFLCPEESAAGSRNGLLLWFQSIVPVLLPFLILSRLLIAWDGLSPLIRLIYPITRKLFGISREGTYVLLFGFLCGYPMGAKLCGDLTREHKISKEEGAFLLMFCNNVSPAFLLGFVLNEQLKEPGLAPFSLMLLYGVPLLLAHVHYRIRKTSFPTPIPGRTEIQASGTIDACIMNGLETILKLGCYIILFSIMACLTLRIPGLTPLISGLLIGVLEITNGVSAVSALQVPLSVRYPSILAILCMGGLCGLSQVHSVLIGSGLSIGTYLRAKLVTTGVILLMAIALLTVLPAALP